MWCGGMSEKNTLRWFGHIERMENEEFVKVYLKSDEGPGRRGRPLGRWEDRVRESMSERGVRGNGLEQARRKCLDRKRRPEVLLLWPPLWGTLLEEVRRQNF